MMRAILEFYDIASDALEKGADIEKIVSLPIREKIGRFKYVEEKDVDNEFSDICTKLTEQMQTTLVKEVF